MSACSFKPVHKSKNIVYDNMTGLKLDVYSPRKVKEVREVIVFVHGGNWRSGKKSLYRFFGKGMARKGLVGVVVDYRLSPATDYKGMAMDVAHALAWVKENIQKKGGDPDKIYISGHSAGAHLAALVALDPFFFDSLKIKNPIKGMIMIDPFGLDMYKFLNSKFDKNPVHYTVFSKDSVTWKKGSPIYYLNKNMPSCLMFLGDRTYPAIKEGCNGFFEEVKKFQPSAQLIHVKRRRHAGMIFNYINPRNKGYEVILNFMKAKRPQD
jgi:hypothetical protein